MGRPAGADLPRRRAGVRSAAAGGHRRAAGARPGPLPRRHQALRQSAPLPGRIGVGALRSEDAHDAGGSAAVMSCVVFSIPAYDYLAAELVRLGDFVSGKVERDEAVTSKTRARILSSIPSARLSNEILLLDLHSEGIPHYFEGTIHPRHVYGKAVVQELALELGVRDFVIGSTDAGRAKWVESH